MDLESTNGTFLNGERISKKVKINNKDVIAEWVRTYVQPGTGRITTPIYSITSQLDTFQSKGNTRRAQFIQAWEPY